MDSAGNISKTFFYFITRIIVALSLISGIVFLIGAIENPSQLTLWNSSILFILVAYISAQGAEKT
jgi:hypothetical protein